MIRTNEKNQWLAHKIVHEDSDKMFAAVVAGNNLGEVWVDHQRDPSCALVWSSGLESFSFMGNTESPSFYQSIASLMDHEIIPFLKKKNIDHFEFSVDAKDWYPAIIQVFGNKEIHESNQFVYKSAMNANEAYSPNRIDPFQAVAIDEAFFHRLNNEDIKNADFLTDYIERYWGTFQHFLGKGYGYTALTPTKEIASIAVSSAMYQSTHAIGVETLEAFKRLGLSSFLLKSLLQKFRENQIAAWWDCMERNIASQKTAEKAGLIQAYRYKVHWFRF